MSNVIKQVGIGNSANINSNNSNYKHTSNYKKISDFIFNHLIELSIAIIAGLVVSYFAFKLGWL